jgi:hypothetical protein
MPKSPASLSHRESLAFQTETSISRISASRTRSSTTDKYSLIASSMFSIAFFFGLSLRPAPR